MHLGSPVAYLVLALWLPLGLALFTLLRPVHAALLVVLGGMLFLPELAMFDAPLLPPIDKHAMAPMVALLGLVLFAQGRIKGARLGRVYGLLLLVLLGSSVLTVMGNPEPLVNGRLVRPGLTRHEVISMAVRDLLLVGQPFLLGMALIRNGADLRLLNRFILGFGLVYSFLILVELRMSPQFHQWVYGYRVDFFGETLRWGGYRPVAFMAHGLAAALFVLAVALQACTRTAKQWLLLPTWLWVLFFGGLLLLTKSTGAIVIGVLFIPVVLWLKPSRQVKIAAAVGLFCCVYPVVKIGGAFPAAPIVKAARQVNADRAQSLEFRFVNDEQLVKRVRQKLWFGWGGHDRGRVYDEDGTDLSTTDGYWVIVLASRGVVGVVCTLGLLLLPIFGSVRTLPRIADPKERALYAGLTVMLAVYTFDLMPNGLFTNIPFFYAGALVRTGRELSQPPSATASHVSAS